MKQPEQPQTKDQTTVLDGKEVHNNIINVIRGWCWSGICFVASQCLAPITLTRQYMWR